MNATNADTTSVPRAFGGSPLMLGLAVVVLIVSGILGLQQLLAARKPVYAEATIKGRTFTLEVADTSAKREKGLGDRDSLSADHGMYFPFSVAQYWTFWMKGMRFPIDIVWIQDGKVVDIDADVPTPQIAPLETYSPAAPADAVLELNAGVAEEIGLQAGDAICFGSCAPTPTRSVTTTPIESPKPVSKPIPCTGFEPKKNASVNAGWKIYDSAEVCVSIEYPSDWTYEEVADPYSGAKTVTFFPLSDVKAKGTPYETPWTGVTLTQAMNLAGSSYGKNAEEALAKLRLQERISFMNGLEAYWQGWHHDESFGGSYTAEIGIIVPSIEGISPILIDTPVSSDVSARQQTIERMLASIDIPY